MKYGYRKEHRDRAWTEGDRQQLLVLHCFHSVGWDKLGRYFGRKWQTCRAESIRLLGDKMALQRLLGDEKIAALRERVTISRKGQDADRDARTRSFMAHSNMSPEDWQNDNQPGQFAMAETEVALGRAVAKRRIYSTNLDRYLARHLDNPYRDLVAELKYIRDTELNKTPLAERLKERSRECLGWIDFLLACCKDKGITPHQHETGEAFTEDYMVATASLGAKGVDLVNAGGGGGKGFWEFPAAAHEAVTQAFRTMTNGKSGQIGSMVVQRVCGHDETLTAVEASMGWPPGHAIVRLREGLDDMMPHYQKIRERRSKRR